MISTRLKQLVNTLIQNNSEKLFLTKILSFWILVTTTSMTLVISKVPFVQISVISANCHNGYATTKKNLWKNVLLFTVPVGFVVRNSLVGWFVKASRTWVNFTEELLLMVKIQKCRVTFGKVLCTSLMTVSQCQLTMLTQQ